MARKSKKDQKTVDQKAASGIASIWADHINEGRQIDRQNERADLREKDALAEQDAHKMGQQIGKDPLDPSANADNFKDWMESHWESIKADNPELKTIAENSPEHAADKEAELRQQFEQVVTEYAQREGVDHQTLRSAGLDPKERENDSPDNTPENVLDAPASEFENDDQEREPEPERDDLEHDQPEKETDEPEHQAAENEADQEKAGGRSLLDKRLEEEGQERTNQPEHQQPQNDDQAKESDEAEQSRSLLDVRQDQMAAAVPGLEDELEA